MSDDTAVRLLKSVPVLKTADYLRAKAFYEGKLGFKVAEEDDDPPNFGIFKRGEATVFIDGLHDGPAPLEKAWDAYVYASDVRALQAELEAAGAHISRPVEETFYQMLEFDVTDPDGNVICFGEDPAWSAKT